jgi:hypothetical protein
MRRPTVLLAALLLALLAAPAATLAQDPASTPSPEATVAPDDPDDDVLAPDEIPPESTPEPDRPCGGPEVDGDYAPCTPCPESGADADYQYCLPLEAGRGEGTPEPAAVAARPLATRQLPLTGGDPLVVALLGAGLLLAGTGLRLRLRPGAPPPSA